MCGDRQDAADLTQEALLRAFTSIQRFDRRAAFYTWLYRIAVNLVIDHRRRQSHAPRTVGPAGADARAERTVDRRASESDEPVHRAAAAEEREIVMTALMQLDDEQRTILVLRDIEQLDYAEIAETLNVPLGTVKSRIFRARQALRERLEQEGH